ncbi:mitochondrial carrier [Gloeophyllum trabeum ATCC 11539]|uniref:Mitochondrial carrier n=1 Tax=Gloeophyllum trabeum (strain ATCC 11539 / FP-39264 / Madison 617) TaxID=670483 RepID=S7S149_GLOTA|nr:mitochondrial carrier [Gloeophyllum trabeum ATCC 11539]EPQ61130.1 mitochondrial carrier [Gloeophyllum trabeum ATCC 11539]
MAACCTHPLDLTKVRMQTLPQSVAGPKGPSTFTVLRFSIAEAGIRSLYTGLTASLMRQMSYSLVRLGSYEKIKYALTTDGSASTTELLLAAALAGGLGGIAGNPADILLVRMTSDSIRPPEKRYGYRNALAGLVRIVKDEGVPGLMRGLGPNVTRAVLMNASQVGSYDYFKTLLLRHRLPMVDYQMQDNLLCHFTASTLAGTVATTICSPADVVKSRMMSLSGNTTPMQMLKESLRTEGPAFLFKGWTPAFIRLVPNTILMFVFFEQLKKQWRLLVSS